MRSPVIAMLVMRSMPAGTPAEHIRAMVPLSGVVCQTPREMAPITGMPAREAQVP